MRRIALIVLFLLGVFPASAAPADDPLTLITAIYKTYQDPNNNNPGLENVFSRRIQDLLDADAKATPKGDAGTIDWDVFVNGNNWELSDVNITLEAKSVTRARVRARFISIKAPKDMMFDLVHEDGRWAIDDIAALEKGGRWTMSKILTHAPDAFPDEKKQETK
jgi:hypothetical protein